MKTHAWSIGIILVALGFTAAQEGSVHEQTIKTMLASSDKITEELIKVVDEDTALAAKPELRKAATAWTDAYKKADKLQPPEKDEKLRLEKLYKPKIEESLKKLFTQTRRVEQVRGGKEALQEIAGVLKKNEK